MTKRLLGWALILGLPLIGIAGFEKIKESFLTERVDKNVSLRMFKDDNYTSKIYDSATASIVISIEKVDGKNRTQVWDTTFGNYSLKKYPSAEKALLKTIPVHGVLEGKEHLEVSYRIIYYLKGYVLQMQNGPYVL